MHPLLLAGLVLAPFPGGDPLSPSDPAPGRRTADERPAKPVRRGQPVMLKVAGGALTITAQGKALADGDIGDVVRVVTSSSRTLEGVVESAGTVRIALIN